MGARPAQPMRGHVAAGRALCAMLRPAMRSLVVPIAAVALILFVGYRQWSLERRLDALARELGNANAEAQRSGASPAQAGVPVAPSDSHAARLSALEASLSSIRADLHSLEEATGDMPQGKPVSDQQILSVMKSQGTKTLETQLKYHRERWLDQREVALADFSKRFGLTPAQNDQVWGLVSSEIDKMVELLRKPESYENPERAANEWKQILLETDAGVHKVLEAQKAIAWDQGRFIERKLLWPWLPD